MLTAPNGSDGRSDNDFQEDLPDTRARTLAEQHLEGVRRRGGMFVEAVRVTGLPMVVTDATLPGNPITFVNQAFVELSGYTNDELLGQQPHFMNGDGTDPEAIAAYARAITAGEDATLEILQYRKDGTPFRAMLFASPLDDGQGRVTNHFLSYLDITRRYEAEKSLRALTQELERRVADRTAELEAANQALHKVAAERELLLVEVNHRAKNSLAVAASLLGLQGRRQPDAAVRALFEQSRDRLNAMSQVHDLLSKSESSQHVPLGIYMGDLCQALLGFAPNDGRIAISSTVEPDILVTADAAFPLGIVITELVTNALKYAFPAPRAGAIRLEAKRQPDGWVRVAVEDDGVGMSNPREGSLGYGLVRTLVKQIGGDLQVRGEPGVMVTITFPTGVQLETPVAA